MAENSNKWPVINFQVAPEIFKEYQETWKRVGARSMAEFSRIWVNKAIAEYKPKTDK